MSGVSTPSTPPKTLEEVLESQRHVIDGLISVFRNGERPIPWFGAGASVAYGFPSWSGFLWNLPLAADDKRAVVDAMDAGEYELAADLAISSMGQAAFEEQFRAAFDRAGATPAGATVVTEGSRLVDGLSVTTNYESVLPTHLEAVFGLPPRIIDVLDTHIVGAVDRPELSAWRIHGPASNPEQRVLSTKEYSDRYGPDGFTRFEQYLNLLFQRRVIFMGCSLASDRTMAAMIKWAATVPPTLTSFAFIEEPAGGVDADRARFLSERHIRPIWYPHGRHDLLPGLIKFVADAVEPMLARPFRNATAGFSIQSRLGIGEARLMSTAHRPHLDLCDLFDGQCLAGGKSWDDVHTNLNHFLTDNPCVGRQTLSLSVHLSISFLLGCRIPTNGTRIPMLEQREGATTSIWHANDGRRGPSYEVEVVDTGSGDAWALIVDTKVNGRAQALAHANADTEIGRAIVLRPRDGDGGSVLGGEHAAALAAQLVQAVHENIPTNNNLVRHLFIIGPSTLAFMIGQRIMNLGRLIPYEFVHAQGGYVPTLVCTRL